MSDSDSDFLTYPAASKVRHGHNATSISGLYQRNYLQSTMDLPRNFEMHRYAEPNYTRNNMYYSKDACNMSVRSFREPQHFKQSYNPRGMGSQRSMINGRCTSPMSVQSIDSNMTRISAMDVRTALLTNKYNNEELKIIRDGYRKLMKNRVEKRRNKIEKRRNKRYWSKRIHHTFGYDSGEQGSNSSVTSDESRATISNTLYNGFDKENVIGNRSYSESSSHRINSIKLARAIKENDMYEDRTVNLKQNSFKNILNVAPGSMYKSTHTELQNTSAVIPQNQRFKSTMQIGSQRFNNTFSTLPIKEQKTMLQINNKELVKKNRNNNVMKNQNYSAIHEYESEEENMIIDKGKNSYIQSKNYGSAKNYSLFGRHTGDAVAERTSTDTNLTKTSSTINKVDKNINDFQFVKPQFPVKRPSSGTNEKIISQSVQIPTKENAIELTRSNTNFQTDEQSETINSLSDVSSRPSFMKRKLFTQTLDVTESKNVSSESLNPNSPQTNVYNQLAKEKNKTRKLAMGQSCLSRDINQDKNLLDLIHKLVPPERMNITLATTKDEIISKDMKSNIRKQETVADAGDKWDVTSIISTYNNNNDVSDVYTDEEIISVNFKTTDNKKRSSKPLVGPKYNEETSQTNKNNIVPKISQKRKDISPKDCVKDHVAKTFNKNFEGVKEHSTLSKTEEKPNKMQKKSHQNERKQSDSLKKNNGVINKKKSYSYVDRFWDDESDVDKTLPECEDRENDSTMGTPTKKNEKLEPIPCVARITNVLTKNGTMPKDQNKYKYNKDKRVLDATNDDSCKKKKIIKESNDKNTSSNIDIKKKSKPIQKGKITTKQKVNPISNNRLYDNNPVPERNSADNKAVVQEDKKLKSIPSTLKSSKQEMINSNKHIQNDKIFAKKIKSTTEESAEKYTKNKNHKSMRSEKCTYVKNKEKNVNNSTIADSPIKIDKKDISEPKIKKKPKGQLNTTNTVQEEQKEKNNIVLDRTRPTVQHEKTNKITKLPNYQTKTINIVQEEQNEKNNIVLDQIRPTVQHEKTNKITKLPNDQTKTINIVQKEQNEKNNIVLDRTRPYIKIFRCDNLKEKSTRFIRELSSLDSSFLSNSNMLSTLSSSCSSQHSMVLRKRPLHSAQKERNCDTCCKNNSRQCLQMSVFNSSVRCLRTRHVDISFQKDQSVDKKSMTLNTSATNKNKKSSAKTSVVQNLKSCTKIISKDSDNISEILESSRSSHNKETSEVKSSCPNATNIIRSRRSDLSFSLKSDGLKKR